MGDRTGMVRAADAALRSNGGGAALLRMPGPAASGDDAEQLGLATPQFQDVPLYPVVFRKNEGMTKLLVSARAVEAVVGSLAFDSVDVLFETAVGVVVDGVQYAITGSVAAQAVGEPLCYSLTLRAPVR